MNDYELDITDEEVEELRRAFGDEVVSDYGLELVEEPMFCDAPDVFDAQEEDDLNGTANPAVSNKALSKSERERGMRLARRRHEMYMMKTADRLELLRKSMNNDEEFKRWKREEYEPFLRVNDRVRILAEALLRYI